MAPMTSDARIQRPRALLLIALYKIAKMAACLVLAAIALRLLRPRVAAQFGDWLESLTWTTHHGAATRAVGWLLGLGPDQYRLFAGVALVYAMLYAVQGVGLWFEKRWAGYLVIIETCLLLPFEVWQLLQRFSPFRLGILVANVAIAIYLLGVLRGPGRRVG